MFALESCDRYELFEREQYKKVFALLSYEDYNIFTEEHDLTNPETEGYIAAVCGGSLPTEKDIDISIAEDPDILLRYNITNYDVKEDEYAQPIPRSRYKIEDYNIRIPAGERTGKMKITMRATGLSPDSVYLLPLKVTKFSSYEVNPDKSYVMYRVLLKNYYAKMNTARQGTTYSLRGKHDDVNLLTNKTLYPVAGDKVRIYAGNLNPAVSVNAVNTSAIVLQIDESNKVHISAWKDIEVEQIDDDPDYPNIFMIEDTGYKQYKTFLLRYDYVYNGVRHTMQEELRYDLENDKQ
jgi:hypothetical protein